MQKFYTDKIEKSERITRLVENLFKKMPEVEAARAVLLTESYKQTENEPMITRRGKAFAHILDSSISAFLTFSLTMPKSQAR